MRTLSILLRGHGPGGESSPSPTRPLDQGTQSKHHLVPNGKGVPVQEASCLPPGGGRAGGWPASGKAPTLRCTARSGSAQARAG